MGSWNSQAIFVFLRFQCKHLNIRIHSMLLTTFEYDSQGIRIEHPQVPRWYPGDTQVISRWYPGETLVALMVSRVHSHLWCLRRGASQVLIWPAPATSVTAARRWLGPSPADRPWLKVVMVEDHSDTQGFLNIVFNILRNDSSARLDLPVITGKWSIHVIQCEDVWGPNHQPFRAMKQLILTGRCTNDQVSGALAPLEVDLDGSHSDVVALGLGGSRLGTWQKNHQESITELYRIAGFNSEASIEQHQTTSVTSLSHGRSIFIFKFIFTIPSLPSWSLATKHRRFIFTALSPTILSYWCERLPGEQWLSQTWAAMRIWRVVEWHEGFFLRLLDERSARMMTYDDKPSARMMINHRIHPQTWWLRH